MNKTLSAFVIALSAVSFVAPAMAADSKTKTETTDKKHDEKNTGKSSH